MKYHTKIPVTVNDVQEYVDIEEHSRGELDCLGDYVVIRNGKRLTKQEVRDLDIKVTMNGRFKMAYGSFTF